MGKYLKQAFVMDLERQLSRGEITHSYMVDAIQEECIKNYTQRKIEVDPDKVIKTEPKMIKDGMVLSDLFLWALGIGALIQILLSFYLYL
jgi:hypothetical protein